MTVYLYDPKTNITAKTTYAELACMTGKTKTSLQKSKNRGNKLKSISCYITDEPASITQRRKWYEDEKYPLEQWKTIQGSNGLFKVSNYGRVKRIYKTTEKMLLPFRRKKTGCLFVKVEYNGKYGEYKVATLVAAHFVGKPNGMSIRHKNGIITDDFAGNLEYITKQELGKKTGYKSKSKGVVKLDRRTGEVVGEYRSAREAGRQCFMSYQTVLDYCNHKRKAKGDYVYLFAEEYEKVEGIV